MIFMLFRSVVSQSCPNPSDLSSSLCLSVGTWEDFQRIVSSNQSENLIFCPFSISKETEEPLLIEKRVSILCQHVGQCIVALSAFSGGRGGRFIRINGSEAQVTVSGFIFFRGGDHSTGSLGSTIHVGYKAGDGKTQLICNSEFKG